VPPVRHGNRKVSRRRTRNPHLPGLPDQLVSTALRALSARFGPFRPSLVSISASPVPASLCRARRSIAQGRRFDARGGAPGRLG
jgi:hypothetical protein